MHSAQHTQEQGDAVTDSEEAHVLDHILQPVEEEDHSDQKHQMVIPCNHVLCTEIQEWADRRSLIRLHEFGVALRYAVGAKHRRQEQHQNNAGANRLRHRVAILP